MTSGALLDGPPAAVLFDFNGTLSDDEPLLLKIFTELFAEHLGWEMSSEEYFERLAGLSDAEIVATAVVEHADGDPHLARALLEQRSARYFELVADNPTIREQTVQLVLTLEANGIPLAIVTGASRSDVQAVLSTQDLSDRFVTMVCNEDVTAGKPHPEGFLTAARQLGVAPERTVVFEDSVPGLRAARAAGMIGIGVAGTAPVDKLETEAAAVLETLDTSALPLIALDHVNDKE